MQRSPAATLIPLAVAAFFFLLISCLATVLGEVMLRYFSLDSGAAARGGLIFGITLMTTPLAIAIFFGVRWLVRQVQRR